MPNSKGEMKVVTTHSGLAYEGPSILINSSLEKIVEQDTEETTDEEHSVQFKEYLECSFHAITPILPTKEPEYSLRECEVTSEDKRECDVPVCENSFFDDHYEILSDLNNDDISSDDDAFKDIDIGFDSFLPSVLLWLVVIMAVVDIGVTVVVVVVESSSVVNLLFVVTLYLYWSM
nr:hypothetical protein [Tanacetum cinerariifolium]